jgi:hypothetical protein
MIVITRPITTWRPTAITIQGEFRMAPLRKATGRKPPELLVDA